MKALILAATAAAFAGCSKPADAPAKAASAAAAAVSAAPAAMPPLLWSVSEGVDTPESAYIDEDSGSLFVSMIAGKPDAKDGNGRIAKLTKDGKMVAPAWVTGLNAPKGLRSYKGTLWTSDIDEVIGIEIATGKITSRIKIPNAKFLNDVACGPDGTVYVSDMLASVIYAIKDGKFSTFASGEQLEYPNGILVDGDRLMVGGWGKPEADFSTKVPGQLLALDLKTAKLTAITPKPFANIDGLEADGHGGWYVSDNPTGRILRINPAGESQVVMTLAPGAADISFTHAGHVLIVPQMNDNKVSAFDLTKAGSTM